MHQLLKTRVLLCLTVISGIVSRLPAVVVAASQDEAAIRAAAKEYLTAMHAGDVDALRKMWTPDGDYVDASGNRFKSREFFSQRATGDAAKSAPAELPPAKSSLRFISPDVAIEDGTNDFAVSPDGEKMTGRFTAVWVKRDGRWLLDSLREATTVEHALNEHLRPLEWLLGEWAGVSKDANILVSSHESDRGQYIVREFLIRREGCEPVSETQRIAWDPDTRQIKSWTFNSQGGSGEGLWRRDGDSWVVDSKAVMANGTKSKTSAVYLPVEEGRFVWTAKSIADAQDAKALGGQLPAERVEFQRAPEDQ